MSTTSEVIPVWLRELCQRLQGAAANDDEALLTEVNLNIRRIDHTMMVVLCEALSSKSCVLKSLNLTSSLVDRSDIMSSSQVAEPLLHHVLSLPTCSLRILHLSYNRLMGPLTGMGKSLSMNQSLRELYLDHNRIDCDTVMDLAKGVGTNSTLEVLQLSSNLISDRGAVHLAKTLVQNKCLRSLGLLHNFIGPTGGQAFVDCLWKHKNTTLTTLDLQNNPDISANILGWSQALCQANALGRNVVLFQPDSGLVPLVLAKASKTPSIIFLFLQEAHSIVPSSFSVREYTPGKKARY